jgi:hypothetical protein
LLSIGLVIPPWLVGWLAKKRKLELDELTGFRLGTKRTELYKYGERTTVGKRRGGLKGGGSFFSFLSLLSWFLHTLFGHFHQRWRWDEGICYPFLILGGEDLCILRLDLFFFSFLFTLPLLLLFILRHYLRRERRI